MNFVNKPLSQFQPNVAQTHQPMKVKVKCGHKDFNKVNLGIFWRFSAVPWFFISLLVCEIFGKELITLFFPRIEPKDDFSNFLNKPLIKLILIKFSGKIEFDVSNQKPKRCGPISSKVKEL